MLVSSILDVLSGSLTWISRGTQTIFSISLRNIFKDQYQCFSFMWSIEIRSRVLLVSIFFYLLEELWLGLWRITDKLFLVQWKKSQAVKKEKKSQSLLYQNSLLISFYRSQQALLRRNIYHYLFFSSKNTSDFMANLYLAHILCILAV